MPRLVAPREFPRQTRSVAARQSIGALVRFVRPRARRDRIVSEIRRDDDSVVAFPQHASASPRVVAPPGAGNLGLFLFLVSLGALFAATLVSYLVVHASLEPRPASLNGPQGLPLLAWVSTILLVVVSVSLQMAWSGIARGLRGPMCGGLATALFASVCFLVSQILGWTSMLTDQTVEQGIRQVQFIFLTGLHAAHVIGGLICLIVVTKRAFSGQYSERWHPGVRYNAIYWHFLFVVWLGVLATLWWTQ